MADWLQQAGCTAVAMESSGVYWRPIFNLLEDSFTLLVVNAQHIKTLPLQYPQWKYGVPVGDD